MHSEESKREMKLKDEEARSLEFAKSKIFSLSDEELEKFLGILHTHNAKGKKTPFEELCKTSPSDWSRTPLAANAACKIFKVKHWHLNNVNLIFDPLDQDRNNITVQKSSILWPDPLGSQAMALEAEEGQEELATLRALSVDGLLAEAQDVAIDNLKILDEVLKGISQDKLSRRAAQELLDGLCYIGTSSILPEAAQEPFVDFAYVLIRLKRMNIQTSGNRADEQLFQYMFESLFRCVAACIKEEGRVKCARTLDGGDLDDMELFIPLKNDEVKNLLVSSRPNLFIYERGADAETKRVIAVVEVKGKARDQILHSDDEDDFEAKTLGVIDKESEEEGEEEEESFLEKMETKLNSNMERLDGDSRRYTRKFLPQLVGEMLCCSETKGMDDIMVNQLGSTLGVAVVGFDVYFVTVVASRKRVQDMLIDPGSHTDVFITRPFNLCERRDRQIVFKVLSAACYVKCPLPSLQQRTLKDLDLGKLAKNETTAL